MMQHKTISLQEALRNSEYHRLSECKIRTASQKEITEELPNQRLQIYQHVSCCFQMAAGM